MSKARQNWMHRADVEFAKFIKARDGHCWRCGSTEYLQCAHIISRSYKAIRVDPDNAVAMCRSHHLYYTNRPLEWRQAVEAEYPGLWDRLTAKALAYPKVDWKTEYELLVGSVGDQ